MHVRTDSIDGEIKVTADAAAELTNVVAGRPQAEHESLGHLERMREVLISHEFPRAHTIDESGLGALSDRMTSIARIVEGLPDGDLATSVAAVNAQLEASAIAPALVAHDGSPLHIHWTSPSTPFAHQVAVDVLMALAQTLCDSGIDRFGRCAADGCDRVFFDITKNRSRRFCADPRCATRTHTAAHRARQAGSTTAV